MSRKKLTNPPQSLNLGEAPTILEPIQQPEIIQPVMQESLPENQTDGHSSTDAILPDFDAAPIPDDESQAAAAPVSEGMEGKVTPSGRMTYEVFDQTFCAIFSLSGQVTGFQTLIAAPSLETRPAATQAMYETILDTPALHFLLNPQGVWMQRAFAMGMFFVPVVTGVAGEMRTRRAPPSKPNGSGNTPAPAAMDEADMRAEVRGQ